MRFFFYGTLIAGHDNPVAREAHGLLCDLGPAAATGALHAVGDPGGWYPLLRAGTAVVHGRLYEAAAGFGEVQLARLDTYEDFDPRDPAASLYIRETMTVTGGAGQVEAQAYRFNQPLPPGARPIPDGDFCAWIAREGLRPYGALS